MIDLLAVAPVPDVNEAGRVLAQLNDWRAMLFALLFLVAVLVGALLWAFAKIAKAVEVVAMLREAIGALSQAAMTAGHDASENRICLRSIQETLSRIEREKRP